MNCNSQECPMVYRFTSGETGFVLDINTNRIFSLTPKEAAVIDRWQLTGSIGDLKQEYPDEVSKIENLQKEGVYYCKNPRGLAFGADWDNIVNEILHQRQQTILELTQQCNLRCKYCTFGGGFPHHRIHSNMMMSDEVIEASIDSAFQHSDQLDEIFVGFYGGEVLLAWDSLEKAISYSEKKAHGKKVVYSLTTNATLMDKQKAKFLGDHGFYILVSLDGPGFLHNQNRVFKNKKGSYKKTVEGLKTLLDVYPQEQQANINLNMVIPNLDWVSSLSRLWHDEPWLNCNIGGRINVVQTPIGFQPESHPYSGMPYEMLQKLWLNHIKNDTHIEIKMLSEQFELPMSSLHQRPIFKEPRHFFFPNGCCIPGARRIFVRADGNYQMCERVHHLPTIGSVKNGVDLKEVKRIVDEFCTESFSDCKNCPAISLCKICYDDAYEGGKFNIDKKRKACADMIEMLKLNLETYGLIATQYPKKLEDWDKVTFK